VQTLVTAQDFADALNRLRLTDPMWEEGGFRVAGRWLEIDPDASDALAATMLRCSIERARRRNEIEARWIVAGGVAVVYTDDHGWQAVPGWRRPVELDEPAANAAVPLLVSEPPVGSSSSAEA
jgi:hypothetical protein